LQIEELVWATEPIAQLVQPVAPDIEAKVPTGQDEQEDWPPGEKVPGAHDRQVLAWTSAYEPAGQAVQVTEPGVLAILSEAQTEQDVAPLEATLVPTEQLKQEVAPGRLENDPDEQTVQEELESAK
jgi:hypothetical protein